jgi:Na+-translocating ferredoxin:NAD+ oxidoreductase subunit E
MQAEAPTTATAEPAPDVLALFALCPLFAVSDTIGNAAASSVAMLVVAGGCTLIAAFLPRWLEDELGFAALALVVTTVVAMISLWAHAWLPGAFESLGVFLPLIVSNVLLMVQVRTAGTTPIRALSTAIRTAVFVLGTMLTLGIARELVGRGSVLRDTEHMFGEWATGLHQQLFREEMGFLLAVLPPGAFFALGLLFALANWWRRRT